MLALPAAAVDAPLVINCFIILDLREKRKEELDNKRAAEKKAKKAEQKNKDRERLTKMKARYDAAKAKARERANAPVKPTKPGATS